MLLNSVIQLYNHSTLSVLPVVLLSICYQWFCRGQQTFFNILFADIIVVRSFSQSQCLVCGPAISDHSLRVLVLETSLASVIDANTICSVTAQHGFPLPTASRFLLEEDSRAESANPRTNAFVLPQDL